MKTAQVLFFLLATAIVFSCNAQGSQEEKQTQVQVKESDQVRVYYFHMSRRCFTCKAVEDVSKQAVQEMDDDKVNFKAYNLEKPEGRKMAKKLKIAGQNLLIVNGDQKINITREGFMNVRNPEKLKQIINQKVNSIQ